MRAVYVAAALGAFALAGAVQAADVQVVLGADLAEKAEELGQGELDRLTEELRRDVERAVASDDALRDADIRLTLVDARPNRPTFEQMAATPGLSMASLSIGGAAIEGEIIAADGSRRSVAYDWYSHNIRDAVGSSTWTDAHRTFDRFASRLADGRL